ncbi:hypothetical protein SNEBB_000996 [Seison nebaliae]|nr:hypothetical protein SNEBB_000996 [Seison nebaliae]
MSKNRSKLREHFTVHTINKLNECNYCDYVIQEKSSTSNLWKHLQSKHQTAYGEAKSMEDTQVLCNNLIVLLVSAQFAPSSLVESAIFKELLDNWKKGLKLPILSIRVTQETTWFKKDQN